MDFSEAERALKNLNARKLRREITDQQYTADLNLLRVQDTSGRWWQPDPASDRWLVWDGNAWQPGIPPAPIAADDNKLMDMQTFREISRTQPWHRRPQKWWDLFSILGGCVSAVIWFLYSGVRSNIEGFDLISPILMIGIPLFMVTYRVQLDDFLIPLQPHRKKFPKLVLVGAGIAVPFLTAFLLYNVFRISQYSLMHWNMLIGTFIAYSITREPILAKGYQAMKGIALKVPLLFIVLLSVIVRIVTADDCLRDPLNARDCLRTGGYAETIAGTASAAASTAINGPEIVRTLTQQRPPASPPGGGGQPGGEGTGPVLTPEEAAEEAQRQADEARRLAEWERQNEAGWQRFTDKGREGMTWDTETGTWMSPSVARNVARERAEAALQQDMGRRLDTMRDQIQYGPHVFDQTRSDVMTRAIDGMLDQIRGGQEVSLEQYERLRTAYGNDIMGNTLPPGQMPPAGENLTEILTETVETSTREILTGKDADGNMSYSSAALRGILGGITGGQSEWVYTPGSSVYDMQEYVNKGGDSVLEAWRRSAERAVIDEVTGRVVEGGINVAGNIGGRVLDNLADRYPGKAEWVARNLGDAQEYLTRERHLWGGTDEAARAASGSGDDIVRAASRQGEDAGRAASGQIDETARAASGQVDETARAASGQIDETARAASGQVDETARAASGQVDETARAASGQVDETARAASGQVDETARRASEAAEGTPIKRVEDIPRSGPRTELKDRMRERIQNLQAERGGAQQLSPSMQTTKANLSVDDVAGRGITRSEQQAIKEVSKNNGAIIEVRPRDARPSHLIETNQALPKGPEVHVKTVKGVEIDKLGYDPKSRDLAVCRRPDPIPSTKPPDMSTREWRDLRTAHAQRTTEFINERPNLEQMVRDNKITWDPDGDAIIRDFKTGKPLTSDIDGFMIRDAANPNLPASPEVQQRVFQDLRDRGIFQHDVHANYDYSHYSPDIPPGSPPGTLSPRQIAENIDHRIIDASRTTNPDKGLLSFNGQTDSVDVVRYTGFTRNPHGIPD